MSPETLQRIGGVLYGRQWQTNLSSDIGVSARTVRNWSSGDVAIPKPKAAQIVRFVRQRADMLTLLASQLEG